MNQGEWKSIIIIINKKDLNREEAHHHSQVVPGSLASKEKILKRLRSSPQVENFENVTTVEKI